MQNLGCLFPLWDGCRSDRGLCPGLAEPGGTGMLSLQQSPAKLSTAVFSPQIYNILLNFSSGGLAGSFLGSRGVLENGKIKLSKSNACMKL